MPPSKPRDAREFVRVSVTLPSDPKLLDTSDVPRCGWLYVCGLTYSREHKTDGVLLPAAVLREASVPKRLAAELVRVGMWHEPGHDCDRCAQPPARHVVVHDYALHNQTRDEIETLREAGRAAATARWSRGTPKTPSKNADRTATGNADRISGSHTEVEAEAEEEKNPLLTYVGRLAGSDASVARGLPAEVIASWQDRAGPDVDLVAEARAYLVRYGTSPARNPGAAWAGWLDKARDRAAATWAAERRLAECPHPDCRGGWLPADDDRPRPCPSCKPHIRPAEEAS